MSEFKVSMSETTAKRDALWLHIERWHAECVAHAEEHRKNAALAPRGHVMPQTIPLGELTITAELFISPQGSEHHELKVSKTSPKIRVEIIK